MGESIMTKRRTTNLITNIIDTAKKTNAAIRAKLSAQQASLATPTSPSIEENLLLANREAEQEAARNAIVKKEWNNDNA